MVNSMIRRLDGQYPAFLLDTDNTTYIFRVNASKHLEHLYYGKKITVSSLDDLFAITQKREFQLGNVVCYSDEDKTEILEDVCLEISSLGKGDIREPFIELVHSDGSATCDFVFSDAEVSDTKVPLESLPSSYSENGEVEHLTVTLCDKSYDIKLELHYCVYPECDCITRSAKIVSGAEAFKIKRLMSLQLDLFGDDYSVTSFHGAWAREMQKSTLNLSSGKFVVESRAGVSSSRANPFFMVHNKNTTENYGDCFGFNLIYSGNHYEAVEVNAYSKTRIVSGINPYGFEFTIEPGGVFESPEAVMTFSPNGFTGQSKNMHAFVRNHIIRGEWKNKIRPILLNSWESCYFKISESSLVSLAKAGKEAGIELFVVDDGWFGERNDDARSLGDWDANQKKLPNGLDGLCKKIKAIGLDFGIWVEPEMVNTQSNLYKAHPDWTIAIPNKPHSEGRNQRILDLTNPEVREYIIEKMTEVFSSAEITYVKWDMNRIFSDVYSPYLPHDRQGEVAHRYVCGLYEIMDTLTKRFPQILFEGCASGGNRFDLGILSYFPQIWASDNTDALERAKIQEGYSYGYPLNTVAAHISASPNHQTLRNMPLNTRFNVAAFGILGYEFDFRDLSRDELNEIKAQIELYKKWRDVLQNGDFYRIRNGNLHEWTCVLNDKSRAVSMILQELAKPNSQLEMCTPKGLDENTKYHFYSLPHIVNIKQFGSLVNTMAPIHVKQDSLLHNAIAKFVKMQGETEDYTLSGDLLMNCGVNLKQAYCGTGFNENTRLFSDFASRMYFIEKI